MLSELTIRNLALIRDCTVQFGPGFTAVTGETGAGKSILLSGLRLLSGDKAPAGLVREGEDRALVEGIFQVRHIASVVKLLESAEIPTDDGEIVIQREILAAGRSRARINGINVSLADLQSIGQRLVQFHGQSDQLLLRVPAVQLEMLDAFACDASALQSYQSAYREFTTSQTRLEELTHKAEELARQREFLQFQLDELGKFHPQADEEEHLESRLHDLESSEHGRKLRDDLLAILFGEANGLCDNARALQSKIQKAMDAWPTAAPVLESLKDACLQLVDSAAELRRTKSPGDFDPAEIERLNTRLGALQRLKRKYRTDNAGLVDLYRTRREEMGLLENADADQEQARKALEKAQAEVQKTGAVLTRERKKAAKELATAVEAGMSELAMAGAAFEVRLVPEETPGNMGLESVEFLVKANAGEGMRPLRSSLSGGELSRVLLAFQGAMAGRDGVAVLVFDEVDSGISGEVAHRIADMLARLGGHHQVLTITHLHQVAAQARQHIMVRKQIRDGRTESSAITVHGEERVSEMRRMLGGGENPEVLAMARSLLGGKG